MATSKQTKSDGKEAYTTFGVPQGSSTNPVNTTTLTKDALSQYERFLNIIDNEQLSLELREELDALKSLPAESGLARNRFDEIQSLLRRVGYSKGTSAPGSGIWDVEDTKGFRKLLMEASASNMPYGTILNLRLASVGESQKPSVSFSKAISEALSLVDKGDARAALSKAMYTAYGYFPTQKQINDFENKWNAEAQRQMATTSTSTTTTTAGKGQTSSRTKTVTTGKGFTEAEQTQFLAQYLKDNFNVKKELGGRAKQLYDEVVNTYKDNLLAGPTFEAATKQVLKLIGTGDADIQKQQLDEFKTKVRRQAKAMYPGWAEYLDQGDDLTDYASNYAKMVSQKLGRQVKPDEEIIKKIMLFSDIKGARPASGTEVNQIVQSTDEWKSSSEAKTAYINTANILARGL